MHKKVYTSFNLYFIIPYLLWLIIGALLLCTFDKQTLFAIVNTHHTSATDVIFYYITMMGEAYTIIIVLLVLLGISWLRNWWYFVAALLCNIIPTIIEQSLKRAFNAPRPLNYFHNADWIHHADSWPVLLSQSFPSGHSTGSFAFFCFLSLLLQQRYKKFGLLFFVLALSVCYSRLYLAAHFFADVYTGSLIGGSVCIIIFAAMRRYQYAFFKNDKHLNQVDI